eukprot:m.365845 g.365845  ORF g.365845 m.365845 type:complete len:101 (-) comp56059_c0_seq11:104-406(-)
MKLQAIASRAGSVEFNQQDAAQGTEAGKALQFVLSRQGLYRYLTFTCKFQGVISPRKVFARTLQQSVMTASRCLLLCVQLSELPARQLALRTLSQLASNS